MTLLLTEIPPTWSSRPDRADYSVSARTYKRFAQHVLAFGGHPQSDSYGEPDVDLLGDGPTGFYEEDFVNFVDRWPTRNFVFQLDETAKSDRIDGNRSAQSHHRSTFRGPPIDGMACKRSGVQIPHPPFVGLVVKRIRADDLWKRPWPGGDCSHPNSTTISGDQISRPLASDVQALFLVLGEAGPHRRIRSRTPPPEIRPRTWLEAHPRMWTLPSRLVFSGHILAETWFF